jgi:hypothetical protein
LTSYPDLPLIPWNTFISRVRIRWTGGVIPESFCNTHGKQQTMKKPVKKVASDMKPAKKSGKGAEKCGKKK